MCGICGELRFDNTLPDPKHTALMLAQLERRGPDSEGQWSDDQLRFGHRRLAVIDLTEQSNQPMVDTALGLTLVFNGAIYNYPQLRRELIQDGYAFFNDGDTEVILKAYHKWGEECVDHLHGMFAFAIWDQHRGSLFLARDRMGIKPLYYTHNANFLRFASNSQALLAAGDVDTSIDPVGLHHQFTLHAVIPAPRTILQGLRKLALATWMRVEANGACQTEHYWGFEARRWPQTLSEVEWTQAIHDALRDAVRMRLDIADVPVGVLLSGGLDSSLLVALLVEAGVPDLLTFSIGFEDVGDEKGSEFEYSDQVVARYNTRHHKIHIPNTQVLDRLPEAVDAMAEPMFAQDAVAFYLLSEQVAKHVKVVQSGQGADEVFAGYFWYPQMHADTEPDPAQRFARYYFDRDHDEFLGTVMPAFHGPDYSSALVAERLTGAGADEYIDQVLRFDVTTLIVDDPVKRVDNMTMAWGLEARVPFLDHKLVELAARMPPELKLGSGGKHVLKTVARDLLPAGVIDRPKGYFPMPALKHVRGPFLDFMRDILNSPACRQRGLYQRPYVEKLLAAPAAPTHFTRLQGSKLWHLALLEFWLQKHVDS